MDKILLRALCSGVQREEVDVEKKGGVEQERLLVSQLLSCQERACTVGGPHHTKNLGGGGSREKGEGEEGSFTSTIVVVAASQNRQV